MRRSSYALVFAVLVGAGCGGQDPFDPDNPRRGPATQLGGQLTPADDLSDPGSKSDRADEGPDSSLPPPPPPSTSKGPAATGPEGTSPFAPTPPETAADTARTAARPGVTGKGQGYGPGPIATPVRAYFSTRERVVFDIQITEAMKVYKALNGHFPKTHEEFMEKIIRENAIQLPELRPGDRYVYDAEKAAEMRAYDPTDPPLMVERSR